MANRLEETLRHRTERLEAMNQLSAAILAAKFPEEIARSALYHVRQLIPLHHARVELIRTDSSEQLVVAVESTGATYQVPAPAVDGPVTPSAEDLCATPARIDDLRALPFLTRAEQRLVQDGIRAYIGVPLIAEGEWLGSLKLGAGQPGNFAPEHLEIAGQVANLLAIAIRQARLTSRVQQANRQLQEALRSREQMIQNVSHELRTPLALIYGYNELLESGDLGALTVIQQRATRVIHEQADRLQFMVDRLLLLQTFSAEQLTPSLVNLRGWLEQTVADWRNRLAHSTEPLEISLELADDLPLIVVDLEYMAHVLQNLLDNAMKFSPRGGEIRLRAYRQGPEVVLAVSDPGIGLAPDALRQIFERFYQVDGSSTRHFGGMGIGLTLCREIVAAHHGRIWAESAGHNRGSSFFVALPVDFDVQPEHTRTVRIA